MAIARMKRLHIAIMTEEQKRFMHDLARLGVVEISETEMCGEGLFKERAEFGQEIRANLESICDATDIVRKYSSVNQGLFSPRVRITETEFFSYDMLLSALSAAEKINEAEKRLKSLYTEQVKLESIRESLVPWRELKVGLDAPSGKYFASTLCTAPSALKTEDIKKAVYDASDCAELYEISSDGELHYMFLIYHRDAEEKLSEAMRGLGMSRVQMRGRGKSVAERISELDLRILEIEKSKSEGLKFLSETAEHYDMLLAAHDALETRLDCAIAASKARATERVLFLDGWFPAREERAVTALLEKYGCAYNFSEPKVGETAPTLTYNTDTVAPFGIITNMYSPPAYRGIDPNPFMAPFFSVFYGIMLSDAGYGLLLTVIGALALWKLNPRGGFKSFMQLSVICGISTIIWGLLFGGIFGDAIPSVYTLFTGREFTRSTALWFDPTVDPMRMLIFSLILGAIQIVAGMAIRGYMMIREGNFRDAIFDIGLWWVVFAGRITALVADTRIGLLICAIGAVGLIVTQGRAKKGIVMKFFGGLVSLYNVTGYFSDILSYSRLLALSLSTAVVASVINTMGVLLGPFGFFIVFIIGHAFNMAINLIGSFVHSARLQYVEFFGKFYESGGELFNPLRIKAKNVDMVREEK